MKRKKWTKKDMKQVVLASASGVFAYSGFILFLVIKDATGPHEVQGQGIGYLIMAIITALALYPPNYWFLFGLVPGVILAVIKLTRRLESK